MFILHERSRLKIVLIVLKLKFPQKVKGKYSSTVRIAPNRTVELINGRTPKTIDIDVKPKGIAYLGGLLD
ncbi:4744_t:CDS:2 [Entrophospora sp. SA101]|nr:4744_t:CDS:2 [Entrophospora sp. SA101]